MPFYFFMEKKQIRILLRNKVNHKKIKHEKD